MDLSVMFELNVRSLSGEWVGVYVKRMRWMQSVLFKRYARKSRNRCFQKNIAPVFMAQGHKIKGKVYPFSFFTPSEVPSNSRLAGRMAKRPFVTTPVIWLIACSISTGLIMFMFQTSRIMLPLSVTTPSR